jgi:parallel beta-helix repeat protein
LFNGSVWQKIDQSNLVEDKILYYLSDQHDVILDPSALPQVGFLGLMHSTNVTIRNMDIYGLVLAFTDDSVITGNTISHCQEGMLLVHSSNNTITGNTASYNEKNIHLSFSSGNTISENTITDSNVHEAILLDTLSNNNKLYDNMLTNNDDGIVLYNSSSNIIVGNTVWNTSWYGFGQGIETWDGSNNNTISGNVVSDNAGSGIRIISSFNTVTENIVTGNGWGGGLGGIYAGDGISLDGVYDYLTECQNNTVSGNTIANTYGDGISIWAASHNTITSNIITNSSGQDGGIWGIAVNNTEIIGNSITNNKNNGIYLYYCFHNNISENYIANNGMYGLSLDGNSSNFIYHNNFINNTMQATSIGESNNTWDNGYPSGGNYWSDYTDSDIYNGPSQDQLGNDSIWDHPYFPSPLESDQYPLVNPWPNTRCTIHFYTNPASPGFSISFESQTYANSETRTCIYGTSGLVTANPPEGYVFDHCETEGNVRVSDYRDNPTYVAISCGGNLTAVFGQIPLPVQITFQASGIGGDASGTVLTIDGTNYTYSQLPQTCTWNVGSKHTVVASNAVSAGSNKRYLWTGWTNGDGLIGRSGTYTVPPSNQTVMANYQTQYYLTVLTSPSEGGYASPASGWRSIGSTVEIEAAAYSGYSFVFWSGSGSGSYTGLNSSASVTMNGPITQVANYEATQISEFPSVAYLEVLILAVTGTAAVFLAPIRRQRTRRKDQATLP